MPADLPFDRRCRERRKRDPAARIEAIRSLHEPDGTDLNEVVELLTAACVATSYCAHKRQVTVNQMRIHADLAHIPVNADTTSD
jgi:hypothetical protein